ncbi:MAG: hypothetical protein SGILL_003868 [Bacillariaceae sp.]
MSGTMDVLPVLTPRFLEYNEDDHYNKQNEERNLPPQSSPWHLPQPTQQQDNTHMFLTERWSEGMIGDGLQGFQSPLKNSMQSSPDIIPTTTPMWISPNNTIKTPSSVMDAFAAAAETAVLPHVPCLAPNTSFDSAANETSTKELGDIPAFICISNTAIDYVLVAAAVTIATNESSSSEMMDEVSLLNDNPDDDDMNLLPHATHDVLANIFDEIYKDESEVEDDDDYNDDDYNELMSK